MTQLMQQRLVLALVGAAAGVSLYALSEILDGDLLGDRAVLALSALTATFFFALLAMTGPLRVERATIAALATGLVVAGLLSLAGLRFDTIDEIANSPIPLAAALVLGTVPLPFIIAAHGRGWRDYPSLFAQAWGIFVRYSVAWVFVGVVWGVVLLSNALFSVVGLTVIEDLLDIGIVPWLVTGTVLGLALAVVQELADVVSPYLVLRLLRLLVPVVLLVLAVFIGALPFRGLSGLFGGLSVAATLLAMTAAAAMLITSAVDQDDLAATEPDLMRAATQGLAVLLPVPAGLAAVAVWLRVDQYGWTPDRLFAATVAAMGLGYGVLYAVAVLRRAGWMDRIRSANTAMALALIGVAALWLTPLFNPEALAARNQMARYVDGQTPVARLDLYALDRWGRAGAAARAELTALAAQPGQEALGLALANPSPDPYTSTAPAEDLGPLRAALIAAMPLQPPTATATRDGFLSAADAYELRSWTDDCLPETAGDLPTCVMVVADLLPSDPGEEALMILLNPAGGFARYEGLSFGNGQLQRKSVWTTEGGALPGFDAAKALIAMLQATPPALSPAPMNQIRVPRPDGSAAEATGLALVP